jgi:mannosyltransferase
VAETDIGPEDPATTFAPPPEGPAPGPAGARPRRLGALRRQGGWLVIAVPAVTSLAVGGYGIGGPSLWRDEAYTKDAITRPAGQIFALLGHQDAVHGAYYLVMHVITAVIGTSATALRLPSLAAMVIATAFTAAIGRRTAAVALAPASHGASAGSPASHAASAGSPASHAASAGSPATDAAPARAPALTVTAAAIRDAGRGLRPDIPALTGLFSGLLIATAPYMTYYAQMARSYAIETMFAAIATYLLLRAVPDGRWRWWLAYAAAVALTGLFNLFGLLILAAHGVTLLLTASRGQTGTGRRLGRIPLRWLAASAAAVIVTGPLLAVAGRQQQQIAWLTTPNVEVMERLLANLAGSRPLILPFALLALAGLAAAWLADDWRPLNPAAVALPWLVVPPFLLIAASFVKPVYFVRYVEFCLPALAILAGAGLAGLVRLAAVTPLGTLRLGRLRLAWLPAAVVIAGLAVLLAGPQQAVRQTAARPDNLRLASAIVAAHEQPGDVVFYIPHNMQVLGTGYPGPFLRLRDIARAESAVASATLTGTEVTSPAVLKRRFTDARRVWVVTGASNFKFPTPFTPADKEKMALLASAGMHVLHRWMADEVMLTLYAS